MATSILGAPIAAALENEVTAIVSELAAAGVVPRLVALAAGHDPASEVYLGRQAKAAARLGMSYEVRRASEPTEAAVLAEIDALNADPSVTGVIVQMPLPAGIRSEVVQARLAPDKDVEGVHPANLGALLESAPTVAPCTAAAVVECLLASNIPLRGADVVVVGRSRIVGRPAALLLVEKDATVTLAHSRSRDLAAVTRRADIVVMAVGRAGLLTPDMLRTGAVVIDVGINEVFTDGKRSIVGDALPTIADVCSAFTPVPGGVGPVTVALLWRNAARLAKRRLAR